MPRLLSFDASTTTIGYSVIDYDQNSAKLIKLDYFKPPKTGHVLERLSRVRSFVQEKIKEFKPDCTAIEEIVLFMGGRSTAKTITSLAVLNRTVGLSILDATNELPYMYNVMKIRHAIKKEKTLPPKEQIPELVAELLNFDFPYVYKKNDKLGDENFDMADAVAVGLCHIFIDREGKATTTPKKKKKKKKAQKK